MLTLSHGSAVASNLSSPTLTDGLTFFELKERGIEAAESGQLADSLEYHQASLELAREAGDEKLVDLAICNCSAALITLGQQQETTSNLRQILMAGRSPETSYLAAYQLSRAHVRDKASKKGLFYAQIARDRALALGREDWLVWGYNQLANCLMDESRFQEATAEYRRALRLQPKAPSVLRGVVSVNLGYSLMMLDRMREGLPLTFQSLRWFRAFGARVYEVWAHMDLCYAYIELARFRRARDHGRRALQMIEETGAVDYLKNALYLLGETEREAGNLEEAWEFFSRLQKQFHPESPHLADLMVAVDMRQLVNLRA